MTSYMIVNAFGRSNRGDSVLLDECIRDIRESDADAVIAGAVFEGIDAIMARHPDIVWSERIGNSESRTPLGRIRALLTLLWGALSTFAPLSWLVALIPAKQRMALADLKAADVVVSAPGGYINDVNFAYYISLYHVWLAKRLGKRMLLAPQSIGPIASGIGRTTARRVLNKADVTCARESYSYQFLLDLGVDPALVRRTGDSAFWNLDVTDDSVAVDAEFALLGLAAGTPVFGMTIVDWSFPDSTRQAEDAERYARSMARIADLVSEKHRLQPVIFNQVREDLPMSRRVQAYAKHPILLDEKDHEPDLLRAMIARSSFFLGTRFHSCIFALMASRPTFAIAYLPKTTYIMQDLKLADRFCPIEAVDIDRVMSLVAADLADPKRAEGAIADAVGVYRREYARFPDVLRTVLGPAAV